MTIGVALKHELGLFLGSDSQFTLGNAPYKTEGTKIERIGNRVGLIGAGSVLVYKDIVRKLADYRQRIDESNVADVTDLVSETVAELYKMYAHRFGKQNVEEAIYLAPMNILVAGLDQDGKPQIFNLVPPGIYGPEEHYGIIGSGIFYAGNAIKRRYTPNMNYERAGVLTVRAIQEAAENDPHVGGEIKLALFTHDTGFHDAPFLANWGKDYLSLYTRLIRAEDMAIRALYGAEVSRSEKLNELAAGMQKLVSELRHEMELERDQGIS